MRQVVFKFFYVTMAVVSLSGCPSLQAPRVTGEAEAAKGITTSMVPMKYSWNSNYSAMLSPPLDIREKASAACKQRGFDRAYMQSISIYEDKATAYFSCRGSDQ